MPIDCHAALDTAGGRKVRGAPYSLVSCRQARPGQSRDVTCVLMLVGLHPARLLERILRGDVANVDLIDAQRLLERLGFEELRVHR